MLQRHASVFRGGSSYHSVGRVVYPSSLMRYPSCYLTKEDWLMISDEFTDKVVLLYLVLKDYRRNSVILFYGDCLLRGFENRVFYKTLQCWLYSSSVLSPSFTLFSSLKYELSHYSLSKGNHILKVRCLTFQERDPFACIPVVSEFMRGFINRSISVYPICKWRIIGTPALSVTWVISFRERKEDKKSSLRNRIMKESWNDFYSDCHWGERKVSSSSYLDYVLRVTGGFSFPKLKCSRKKQYDEVDDIVFDKYADKETRGTSVPVLPLVLITFSLVLVISIFCFMFFIFPLLNKYLFYFVC